MLRTGFINYLNSQPLYFGLSHSELEIITAEPKQLATMLFQQELTFSQVSVLEYFKNQHNLKLFRNFCISSAKDRVPSVLLLSRKQIHELDGEEIILTNQSVTSIQLLKVLTQQKYKIQPTWKSASVDASDLANDNLKNVLLIGDQALLAWQKKLNGELPTWNCFDLANLWFNWTGLPFVFAVFVGHQSSQLPEPVLRLIKQNLETNLQNIHKVVQANSGKGISEDVLREYFSLLDYQLDEQKLLSMKKFAALSGFEAQFDLTEN
jgi:chorismate dehydratase